MRAESIFSEFFQWLMTSRRHIHLHTHKLWSWIQFLEMGLIFRVILLFIRGEPLSKFSLKCVNLSNHWPPLSNQGSGVFVFEIFAFKVFEFIHEHSAIFSTFWSFITRNHNSNLSDHYQHSSLVKGLAFAVFPFILTYCSGQPWQQFLAQIHGIVYTWT